MLEKAFAALKTLDYGDDLEPLGAIDDAIAQTKDDPGSAEGIEEGLLVILNGDRQIRRVFCKDGENYFPIQRASPWRQGLTPVSCINKIHDGVFCVRQMGVRRSAARC